MSLEQLLRLIVEENDQTELINILKQLRNMKARYDEQVSAVDRENTRIETVHKVIKTLSTKHNRTISDRQKKQSAFTERTADMKGQIVELIQRERELKIFVPNIPTKKIQPHSNHMLDYEFISKLRSVYKELHADHETGC